MRTYATFNTLTNQSVQFTFISTINPMTKYKTTPEEKIIIKLMEMVIDTLKECGDLSDPAFAMYEVMKDAVEKEVYYPLYD